MKKKLRSLWAWLTAPSPAYVHLPYPLSDEAELEEAQDVPARAVITGTLNAWEAQSDLLRAKLCEARKNLNSEPVGSSLFHLYALQCQALALQLRLRDKAAAAAVAPVAEPREPTPEQ